MSTSLLYHGLGIYGYQHLSTKFHNGAIHFRYSRTASPSVAYHAVPITSNPEVR